MADQLFGDDDQGVGGGFDDENGGFDDEMGGMDGDEAMGGFDEAAPLGDEEAAAAGGGGGIGRAQEDEEEYVPEEEQVYEPQSAELVREDAATHRFGPIKDEDLRASGPHGRATTRILSNAEVAAYLQDVINDSRKKSLHVTKAYDYAMRFGIQPLAGQADAQRLFRETDFAACMDALHTDLASLRFDSPEDPNLRLHQFEVVSLINLLPSTVEEAQCWIPSLFSWEPQHIEEVLEVLEKHRVKLRQAAEAGSGDA